MGRKACCSKELGLNRGAWTVMEDKILTEYIKIHGEGQWRNLPERAGLKRCGKSCRLRWFNYLNPGIKRGSISQEEEDLIIRLHKLLGNRWALIAGRLPGRTDNEIKNYWHTKLSKLTNKLGAALNINASNQISLSKPNEIKEKKHSLCEPQVLDNPNLNDRKKTSDVVRTNASRCTKPVVVPCPVAEAQEKLDDHRPAAAVQQGPLINSDHQFDRESIYSTTTAEIEPLLLSDFVMDQEYYFLSDFFNTDWISELPNHSGNGGESSSINDINYDKDSDLWSQSWTPLYNWLQFPNPE